MEESVAKASEEESSSLPTYTEATKTNKEANRQSVLSTTLSTGSCQITLVSPSQENPGRQKDVLSCQQTTVIRMVRGIDTAVEVIKGQPTTIAVSENADENHYPIENASQRITWDRNWDFLLSIIGFAVDLANVWRFPYLCYKNGGGAFLIPYSLMLVFGALPLFYMEIILGQYNRQGPISLWRICPLFKGVGYCAVFIAFFVSFYYNVVIGWAVFYLTSSFSLKLPWTGCDNEWNSDRCTLSCFNTTQAECLHSSSPAKEYFNRGVLRLHESKGVFDGGAPIPQLAVCIAVVYSMLYISLFKGVKSTGKVVWITATMPYVLLTILLVRGLVLPGAADGIMFYLVPDLAKLKNPQVWIDAAVQIFYSVGAGFGVHLSYASYNKFDNNCYRDCVVTSIVNSCTSFFSGFVIFTYLGYMSKLQHKDIQSVAEQGPGLVFEVYPEAIATLPASQVWSVLFFVMLIFLGMDSAMGGLECVITGLMDEFSSFFKRHRISRELFTFVVVFSSFSVALSCVTPSGFYVFNLLERYAASLSLLATVLFEAIAVSWIYGLQNLKSNVFEMLGRTPSLYWRVCWKLISPCFLTFIIVLEMLDARPLAMKMYDNVMYTYPEEAKLLGCLLSVSSVMMIPLVALKTLCTAKGSLKQRLLESMSPPEEVIEIREGKPAKRAQLDHWISL